MYSGETVLRVVFSVLVIINVLGNSLVILVISTKRSLWTQMNYLLLNLAVADLMVGISMAPVFILDKTFTHPRGPSGDMLCKFITSGNFTWIGSLSSIFSLVLIAIERYYATMKPLSIRHKITTKKLKIFIPLSWSIAVLFNIPQFIADYFNENPLLLICLQRWPTAWLPQFYSLLWIFVAGIIPTSIMTVLYSRVIYSFWFQSANPANHATTQVVRRSRKAVTKTMLTVTAIYVLCWFPDLIIYVLSNFLPNQIAYRSPVQIAAISLVLINSSANPVVYALQFEQFRRGVRRMGCCGGRRVKHVRPRRTILVNARRGRVDCSEL